MNRELYSKHGGKVVEAGKKYKLKISEIVDFSSSMNDFASVPDPSIIFTRENIGLYPGDDSELRHRIAVYSNVDKEDILLGPGLSYFIYRLADIYRGKRVGVIRPTFSEYEKAFRTYGSPVSLFGSDDVQRVKRSIKGKEIDLMCMTRPDTPTGNIIDEGSVLEIAECCLDENICLFIDEAFQDFLEPEQRDFSGKLLEKYPNVILGRSLSKVFSTPSLRAGYIISSHAILEEFKKRMEPWALGKPILDFFLGCRFEKIEEDSIQMRAERDYLTDRMEEIGFQLVGKPSANYVCFNCPGEVDTAKLCEYLARNGILIRTLDDYPEFGARYFRVSVKRREKNDLLISRLTQYLSTQNKK